MASADTSVTLDLTCAGDTITFLEAGVVPGRIPPFVFVNSGIKGLYDTPTSKTSLTERQTGDGAHTVIDSDVLYSTRTVSIPFAANRGEGDSLNEARDRINRMAHHAGVRLTVHDNGVDSFVTGYITVAWSDIFWNEYDSGTITLTCADPCRYSVDEQSVTLFPTSSAAGMGLFYTGQKILYYPISYSDPDDWDDKDAAQQNIASLSNDGSTTAYPVLEADGGFPHGVRVDWMASDGAYGTLDWQGQPGAQPTIFDCKTHTVSIGGLDQTSLLTRRGFPHVPAHGSCRFVLQSAGTGWVNVKTRDTWI